MFLVFRLSPAISLTMPCWTCPSFNSLRRCPLPSESSWTTHSEDTSSPSFGPSYTGLQLISAEEQSGLASRADSTGKMEPQARGLCKSLLVTCCHSSNLCSQLCLQNEFRHSHPVKKLESWVVQNCTGEKHAHRLAGWLARLSILGNHLTVYLKGLFSDCSVQVRFPVSLYSPWLTELCVIWTRLNLSSYHPRTFPIQQEGGYI